MRKLIASTFVSLDGVMQAPGGPEEDPTGGFTLGGWMFNYSDEAMDIQDAGFDGKDRELVLGRRTYEIFEAYWPYQADDNPIARTFNAARKHVASHTLTTLRWNNSTLLDGDVVSAVIALKTQPGPDLQIIGSGNLIQTLQAASLIDEYNVWTYPVVLGRGKRLFGETAKPSALRLVRSQVSFKPTPRWIVASAAACRRKTSSQPRRGIRAGSACSAGRPFSRRPVSLPMSPARGRPPPLP